MITKKDLIRKFPNLDQSSMGTEIYWVKEDTDELVKWINNKILTPQKMNDRIMMVKVKLNKLSNKIKNDKKMLFKK